MHSFLLVLLLTHERSSSSAFVEASLAGPRVGAGGSAKRHAQPAATTSSSVRGRSRGNGGRARVSCKTPASSGRGSSHLAQRACQAAAKVRSTAAGPPCNPSGVSTSGGGACNAGWRIQRKTLRPPLATSSLTNRHHWSTRQVLRAAAKSKCHARKSKTAPSRASRVAGKVPPTRED